jgi:hypothetical protein
MKLSGWKMAVVCVGLLGALGCCGVTIATPKHAGSGDATLGEAKISSVTVTSNSALEGDKQELITKNDVPNKLQAALTDSLKSGKHVDPAGTLKLTVEITEMRLPSNPGIGGADHVAGKVTLTDASGAVVTTFDANGTSAKGMFMNSGRASRFSGILTEFAQKIVDQL